AASALPVLRIAAGRRLDARAAAIPPDPVAADAQGTGLVGAAARQTGRHPVRSGIGGSGPPGLPGHGPDAGARGLNTDVAVPPGLGVTANHPHAAADRFGARP